MSYGGKINLNEDIGLAYLELVLDSPNFKNDKMYIMYIYFSH